MLLRPCQDVGGKRKYLQGPDFYSKLINKQGLTKTYEMQQPQDVL